MIMAIVFLFKKTDRSYLYYYCHDVEFINLHSIYFNPFWRVFIINNFDFDKMQAANNAVIGNATINARDFGAKFRSKKECYTFLCVNVGAYLPP